MIIIKAKSPIPKINIVSYYSGCSYDVPKLTEPVEIHPGQIRKR
jgi:hypothetical protein